MRWKGETANQRILRTQKWHKHFLLWPRQMSKGSWIWLETVWRKRIRYGSTDRNSWRYSDSVTAPEEVFR